MLSANLQPPAVTHLPYPCTQHPHRPLDAAHLHLHLHLHLHPCCYCSPVRLHLLCRHRLLRRPHPLPPAAAARAAAVPRAARGRVPAGCVWVQGLGSSSAQHTGIMVAMPVAWAVAARWGGRLVGEMGWTWCEHQCWPLSTLVPAATPCMASHTTQWGMTHRPITRTRTRASNTRPPCCTTYLLPRFLGTSPHPLVLIRFPSPTLPFPPQA